MGRPSTTLRYECGALLRSPARGPDERRGRAVSSGMSRTATSYRTSGPRERVDGRGQLHPIVRRVTRAAAELGHLAIGCDDDRAPASRPGVPLRGPVREDDDRHVRHGPAYPPPWPGINMLRIASSGDARYKRIEPWRDPTRRTSRP